MGLVILIAGSTAKPSPMQDSTLFALRPLVAGCLLSTAVSAQQFESVPGLIPGPALWSEGVEAVDVDADGDFDLCFAEGAGYSSPETQHQQVLVINQLVETGSLSFTEESVARLGTQLACGKGVTSGDVDGDGWVDLLYYSAFNLDAPMLFINRGQAQPGFFDLESAARGFTEPISCGGAQFGDLDNDGDLDVILSDSGNNFIFGPGGKPRLYFNDGTGHFTEDAAALGASTKLAQMDVHLVDIDGDWDVDFVGLNRNTNNGEAHYIMLNDGAGTFADVSSLMPLTSNFVYEAETADLDGDDDVDLFFTSISGFQEGSMRNELVETGGLGFSVDDVLSPEIDDNEIVLLDYDNDRDLDAFIGSLGPRERIARNDGGLQFTNASSAIEAVSDPTLDMTAADLDNDGDYDLITAQGESNPAQWASKVYLNSGPADTTPPRVVGVHVPDSSFAWPVVLMTKHQDSVLDDGKDYVDVRLFAAPQSPNDGSLVWAGGFWLGSPITVPVGQAVSFNNQAGTTTLTLVSGPVPFSVPFPFSMGGNGDTQRSFAVPGTYVVQAGTSASFATIEVTGSPAQVESLRMGEGQSRLAVPDLGPAPQMSFVADIRFTDDAGNVSWEHVENVAYPRGGSNYCGPSPANSTGQSSSISGQGSPQLAAMNFGLVAANMPSNQFGYFLVSATDGFVANPGGSQGNLCLGGTVGRFRSQVQNSGANGSFAIPVDLGALPFSPAIAVQSGETWNFQGWHRDVGGTSNFTDGLAVTFR